MWKNREASRGGITCHMYALDDVLQFSFLLPLAVQYYVRRPPASYLPLQTANVSFVSRKSMLKQTEKEVNKG